MRAPEYSPMQYDQRLRRFQEARAAIFAEPERMNFIPSLQERNRKHELSLFGPEMRHGRRPQYLPSADCSESDDQCERKGQGAGYGC